MLDQFQLYRLRDGPVGLLEALFPFLMKDLGINSSDEDFPVLEGTFDLDDFFIVLGVVFDFFSLGLAGGNCLTNVQTYILFNQLHMDII